MYHLYCGNNVKCFTSIKKVKSKKTNQVYQKTWANIEP